MLEDRSVDDVLVMTPPNTHLDLFRRAASAGKHVLLESRWRSARPAPKRWLPPVEPPA